MSLNEADLHSHILKVNKNFVLLRVMKMHMYENRTIKIKKQAPLDCERCLVNEGIIVNILITNMHKMQLVVIKANQSQ